MQKTVDETEHVGVTRKVLIIGMFLILLNSFWTIQHHEKFYASWSIFYNVIFIVFVFARLTNDEASYG